MADIFINIDICRKCGACALVCPRGIFQQVEKRTSPKLVDTQFCMECGACMSMCPSGAITHSAYPEGTITPIQSEILPTYDQLLEIIRSRRSKRVFKDKPVSREDIDKILEVTRFAPSEHNVQDTEIIVIQDKKIIYEIAALTSGNYQRLVRILENPVGRLMFTIIFGKRSTDSIIGFIPDMKGVTELFDAGQDIILRQAPVLLVFCADRVGGFPEINAQLAAQNAILAAESLGFACFFAGFVLRASRRVAKIRELINLPKTHEIYGILALGYSKIKFHKWSDRKPLKAKWI